MYSHWSIAEPEPALWNAESVGWTDSILGCTPSNTYVGYMWYTQLVGDVSLVTCGNQYVFKWNAMLFTNPSKWSLFDFRSNESVGSSNIWASLRVPGAASTSRPSMGSWGNRRRSRSTCWFIGWDTNGVELCLAERTVVELNLASDSAYLETDGPVVVAERRANV